jgi:hypothetical protein
MATCHILRMPVELQLEIADHLSATALWSLSRTNSHYRSLIGAGRPLDAAEHPQIARLLQRSNYVSPGHLVCTLCAYTKTAKDFCGLGETEEELQERYRMGYVSRCGSCYGVVAENALYYN